MARICRQQACVRNSGETAELTSSSWLRGKVEAGILAGLEDEKQIRCGNDNKKSEN